MQRQTFQGRRATLRESKSILKESRFESKILRHEEVSLEMTQQQSETQRKMLTPLPEDALNENIE